MHKNVTAIDQMAKCVSFLIAVLNIEEPQLTKTGSNLTNQLVGLLIKFKVGPVGFMADIQAMFYQVKVKEKQRSFLRFL